MAATRYTALIRLKRYALDEARQGLAQLLKEADRLEDAEAALLEERRAEQKATQAEHAPAFGAFVQEGLRRQARLRVARAELEDRIAVAMEAVRAAFQEVKALVVAEQAALKEAAEAEKLRESIELDEMAIERFRRRALLEEYGRGDEA